MREQIGIVETTLDQEKLISKLVDYVNKYYVPTEKISDEFIGRIRKGHLESIESRNIDGLKKLAEKIDNQHSYDMKFQDTEEDRQHLKDLESLRQNLLKWIRLLEKNNFL